MKPMGASATHAADNDGVLVLNTVGLSDVRILDCMCVLCRRKKSYLYENADVAFVALSGLGGRLISFQNC